MSETIDKQKLLSEINVRRKADFIALKPDNTRNQMRCEMWAEFYDMVEKFESSRDQTEPSVDRVREESCECGCGGIYTCGEREYTP